MMLELLDGWGIYGDEHGNSFAYSLSLASWLTISHIKVHETAVSKKIPC